MGGIKRLKLAVVVHKAAEGGYWADVPSLPGCVSQGETMEETLTNVKEAIELFLETMIEDGENIPPGEEEGRTVTVSLPLPV